MWKYLAEEYKRQLKALLVICADFVTKGQCKKHDADKSYANNYQDHIV